MKIKTCLAGALCVLLTVYSCSKEELSPTDSNDLSNVKNANVLSAISVSTAGIFDMQSADTCQSPGGGCSMSVEVLNPYKEVGVSQAFTEADGRQYIYMFMQDMPCILDGYFYGANSGNLSVSNAVAELMGANELTILEGNYTYYSNPITVDNTTTGVPQTYPFGYSKVQVSYE